MVSIDTALFPGKILPEETNTKVAGIIITQIRVMSNLFNPLLILITVC